jgi:hypothetical protein
MEIRSRQTVAPKQQSPHPHSQPTKSAVAPNPNSVDLPQFETLLTLNLQSNCTKHESEWTISKFINESSVKNR